VNPISRVLFGRGDLSPARRAELEPEGIVRCEKGLAGSITARHLKAPGQRSNWRKDAIRAVLVVTGRRLAIYARDRPVVDVAFDDPRFADVA
jgi:hypothetical protein